MGAVCVFTLVASFADISPDIEDVLTNFCGHRAMACCMSSVGVTVQASARTQVVQRPSRVLRLPLGLRGSVARGSQVALSARTARALAGDASLHTAVVAYWVRRNRWTSRLSRGGQAAQVRTSP